MRSKSISNSRWFVRTLVMFFVMAATSYAEDKTPTAKMPAVMINPREGIRGNTIYTLAHPGVPMEMPIQVQGGAFPFTYALTGPKGMTIGSTYGDPDYGILKWAKPRPGVHKVTVAATDQEGTTVRRSYELRVISDPKATDQFIFVDADAPKGGDGGIARPFKDIADAQKKEHADKTVIVRQGRYAVTNSDFQRNAPRRWIGFPGESVVFVNRKHATNWATGDGACINITWDEIHQDVVYGVDVKHGNGGCMRIWDGGIGFVGYKLKFLNFTFHPGEPANLNQACIMTPNTSKYKLNIGLSDILLDNFAYVGIETYKVRNCLLERIKAKNAVQGNGAPILFHKVAVKYATTRQCTVWEKIPSSRVAYEWYCGDVPSHEADHGELCFSLMRDASHQRGGSLNGFPHWSYRNTFVGKVTDRGESGPFVYANNVIVTPNKKTFKDSGVYYKTPKQGVTRFPPDVSDQKAAFIGADWRNVLKPDGTLKGKAREKYCGRHGHEIVVENKPLH